MESDKEPVVTADKQSCEDAHKKAIDNRLASIEGHVKAVRKMAMSEHKCEEILSQVAAIQRALKAAGLELLKSHVGDYIKDTLPGSSGKEVSEEFNRLLSSFLWLE